MERRAAQQKPSYKTKGTPTYQHQEGEGGCQ